MIHFAAQQKDCEATMKVNVLVTQSCLALYDPMDCSPPGSSVHEILQASYQGRLPFPSPGDPPDPGLVPGSPVIAGGLFTAEPSGTPIGKKRKKKIGDPSPPVVLETLIFLFCPDGFLK